MGRWLHFPMLVFLPSCGHRREMTFQRVVVGENLSSASYEPSLHWLLGGVQTDNRSVSRVALCTPARTVLGHFNLQSAASAPTSLFACACRVKPQAFRLVVLAMSLLKLLLYLEFSSQLQIPGVPVPALPSWCSEQVPKFKLGGAGSY